MMRRALGRVRGVRHGPLLESTLAACKVLIVALMLTECVHTAVTQAFAPALLAILVLSLASVVAALWGRPGLGVALALAPMSTSGLFPYTTIVLTPMFVTATAAAARWAPPVALLLAAGYGTLIALDAVLVASMVTEWGVAGLRAAMHCVGLTVALMLGFTLKLVLRRSRSGEHDIERLERQVAEVRRDERDRLADELSELLVDGLSGSAAALRAATATCDPAELRRCLDEAEEDARTALGRLRRLVSTLRGENDFDDDHDRLADIDDDIDDDLDDEAAREVEAHRVEDNPVTSETDAEPTRAARTLRLRERIGRLAVAGLGVATLARAMQVTIAGATAGSSGWTEGIVWSLLGLGVATLAISSRLAMPVLGTGLAAGLVLWSGPPEALVSEPAVLLAGVFTGTVVARRPRWLLAALAGAAGYLALWGRGQLDSESLVAAFFLPWLGAAAGLAVHHFAAVRAAQLVRIDRLHGERFSARAHERAQLAGELHDVVAHQLSLVSLHIMGRRTHTDLESLRHTASRVAAITESARADLTTLAAVMRAHHDVAAADRAIVGATGSAGLTAATGSTGSNGSNGSNSGERTDTASDTADAATWLSPAAVAPGVATTLREAGHRVEVVTEVGACDPTTARTVSRILREASTNVLRYAPAGTGTAGAAATAGSTHAPGPTSIEVTGGPDAVQVSVRSPLSSEPVTSPYSSGYGLLGLRERVDLTGGEFSAGPVDGEWVVRANLPLLESRPAAR